MKRVVRNVFSEELYALADGVYLVLVLREDINATLRKTVLVVVLTNSLIFCNIVFPTSTVTTEKGLMIDIAAIRKANDRRDIEELRWIRTGHNLSDAFTKPRSCLYCATSGRYSRTQMDEVEV